MNANRKIPPLQCGINVAERQLEVFSDSITASPTSNYEEWRRQRLDAETVLVAALRASRFRVKQGDPATIAKAGLRSSSTAGVASALALWRDRAVKKLEALS